MHFVFLNLSLKDLQSHGELFYFLQVAVRNVPHVPGHTISDTIDHFFQTNHPNNYLCHQVLYFLKRILMGSVPLPYNNSNPTGISYWTNNILMMFVSLLSL